jgi:hypothetical protein
VHVQRFTGRVEEIATFALGYAKIGFEPVCLSPHIERRLAP